ncbi:protein mono-ADP-ribosyltransferase PARP12-like isoform X2 [Dermochelys coriacea]|uniref:protein mono-ADP-ribosyltransferase PARP12-like isoform X2 n=1 Tax=Dermochelys coriacea TaxID=27794 RepID=UPI001CA7DBCF|nr:protein mono-ADP-ribosyltransferase PARP12-like isoform X2 [Dermochelys coriacea]
MARPALPTQALQALCAAGGSLEQGELSRRLPALSPSLDSLWLTEPEWFTLVTRPGPGSPGGPPQEQRVVVATSAVRLCPEHGGPGPGCGGQCGQLHICRYFLYGNCRHQRTRKECKFVHNFQSEHNLSVLKKHGLQNLNDDELRQLLLQNDSSLLPEVCMHYNKGDGLYGSCTFKKICTKLHMCQYYLQGECRFGNSCKRSHNILNLECYEKLERRGMSPNLIAKLPSIFRNMYDIKNGTFSPCKARRDSLSQVSLNTNSNEELDEICLYYIRKSCSFQDKCIRVHFHLPYRWQILEGALWKDLKDMEKIEKAYCDPSNNRFLYSGLQYIYFQNMTCGSAKVRRLSTASSVTKPPHFILTTDWLWYWKDEYGVWREYGTEDGDHDASTVSSGDLEHAYLAKVPPTLQFKAGRHEYELNFKAMNQRNLHYKTQREVCRRPKFISPQDVEKRRISGVEHSQEESIPAHWDKSALPELGYQLIKLLSSSDEYKKVQADFQRTMPKTVIQEIQRIQNPTLWKVYQWQKEQMLKTNGGKDVCEKLLFHGTSKKHIDAICQQNFDWRICGLHGTAYGKGSQQSYQLYLCLLQEATLQGMHRTLITIARRPQTSRPCFWLGSWWGTLPLVGLPIFVLPPRTAETISMTAA